MFFQGNEKYNCATYLRLSRSDGDQQESNSIKNQRALLNDYMGKHPELHKFDEYVDDGYSGTNFERPDFKRMMQDIEKRNVNCIIVKDLSRFGRNYIETGRYLERIFPFMGVRFIAINDHYDSAEENDDKGRILIPFNNLINDTYCRDISLRVRSHLDVKRKEGQFIGSFAGYGYRKDPKDKNHLIIDEYAAGIVQEIFKSKLNGMSSQRIASHLNELGVLPPNEYKRANGFNYTCGFQAGLNQKWTVVSVNRILKNESYTGTLIQGKRRKINYKVKKSHDVGSENWIRVEDNSFDSMKLNNGTPGIEVAVSNLVNNMYSRDIAKKIRAALETNWKNGKATCTNVPFGYVRNKKGGQRWEIDPEAAPCVKKVFELALSGRNTTQIAYGMNELNLPTPGLYAKRKNLLMGSNPIIAPDSEMLWNAAIVWRILRRYEYTGALVMGRRKKIDVNTTSVRTLPEDKWIIAENAHAAIVTKDEYYQAQKAIRNVTPIQYKVGDDFALKGKICCGNCNRQLRHERQYGEMVFYCGYKRSAGKFSKCYGGYYREYSVNAKVARAIKTVFYALDVVNQGMQEKQSITVRCMDIEDLEKQAEAIRVEQIKLYESYADGVLLRDAYIEKKKTLSEKLAALQDSIRTEKEEQECADELDEEIRNLTKQASQKTYIGGLTKECVDAFVSMVYLYDDQTMKVEFNCEDVIRRALEKYGA